MSKKIIVSLIIIFILVSGGCFYFLKTTDVLSNNPFLASVAGFLSFGHGEKKIFSLSEEEFSSLKQRMAFLEESLEAREEELENLDDLTEKFDEFDQKITELEAGMQVLAGEISEVQEQEETAQEEELDEEELEESEEEKEAGQEVGQKLCEVAIGIQPLRNKIIINEIAWMGTSVSVSKEWIELKNISGTTINLKGWQLLDKDQQVKIVFSSGGQTSAKLSANGFLLLERTDDNSMPGIAADLIYSGTLSNADEALYLFDENCQLQDEVLAAPDWPAGDNSSKRTMERKGDFTWQTSFNPGGTPKAENSSGYVVVAPPSGGGGGGGTPPPVLQPAEVVINEIMYDLEGSDDGREWIEIFNIDAKNADLTGWGFYENETNHSLNLIQGTVSLVPLDYAVIVDNAEEFLDDYPDFSGNLFDSAFSLSNTGENIAIKAGNEIIDQVNYNSSWGANGDGNSLQRVSPEEDSNNSQNWQGAFPTPGVENHFPQTDTTPPARTDGLPAGTLSAGTIETNISLTADEIATCKYSINPDQDYDLMTDTFLTTNGTSHSALITGLTDGISYNYYVRCVDTAGNKNTDDFIITFSITLPPVVNHLVINEVYYDTGKKNIDGDTDVEKDNEWIEIYNPNNVPINITDWKICDNNSCDIIPSSDLIPVNSLAVITAKDTTWNFWDIPYDVVKIVLNNLIGNGLANTADMLILKDNEDNIADQINWGTSDPGWPNYNSELWSPGPTVAEEGHSLAREPKGYDTNQPSDWIDLLNPNPGY